MIDGAVEFSYVYTEHMQNLSIFDKGMLKFPTITAVHLLLLRFYQFCLMNFDALLIGAYTLRIVRLPWWSANKNKNLPVNAWDMVLIPGPGRFHISWSN